MKHHPTPHSTAANVDVGKVAVLDVGAQCLPANPEVGRGLHRREEAGAGHRQSRSCRLLEANIHLLQDTVLLELGRNWPKAG